MTEPSEASASPFGCDIAKLLTPAKQEQLLRAGTQFSCAADGTIYREGDAAGHLYLLDRGIVRASRLLLDGNRQLVSFLWSGDMFGLSEAGRYVNSLEAVCDSVLHRIPIAAMEAMLREDAQLALGFAIRAAHELRTAQGHILCLGQLDVQRRVARFLLDCTEQPELFDRASGVLILPMKRLDMADYLGATVEAVARALTRLEREGLIRRLTRRDILLPDPEALGCYAGWARQPI